MYTTAAAKQAGQAGDGNGELRRTPRSAEGKFSQQRCPLFGCLLKLFRLGAKPHRANRGVATLRTGRSPATFDALKLAVPREARTPIRTVVPVSRRLLGQGCWRPPRWASCFFKHGMSSLRAL